MVLALFFTRGVSLEIWVKQGLLDREKLVYEEHLNQKNLRKVIWLTYGYGDKKLSEQLKKDNKLHPNIFVIEMPRLFNILKIGGSVYSFLAPFLYPSLFQQVDILKTNQMDGAWSGVIAKWLYKKPLICRTGYTLSIFLQKQNREFKAWIFGKVESFVYKFSNLGLVASQQDRQYFVEKYNLPLGRIRVVPNYINTDQFKPLKIKKYENRIIFVGRLNQQKNLFNLIRAISDTNLILDIYGNGELEASLKDFARKKRARVNFMGIIENSSLPSIYNQYQYYILPSYHEGTPKTLLEAMACGCLCVGTDVVGINEIIKSNQNGVLVSTTSSEDILIALKKAINSKDKDALIQNGVTLIRRRYAINVVVKKEFFMFGYLGVFRQDV